jgi:FAD/FMN-containing dehydrogenase
LQEVVGRQGQWLPVDPPHPERLTIAELLSANLAGPRRFGYGTIRDYLIGLQVALPDGRLAASGGNVVKNVAGYDLMKLFVGARDTLGFPVEATFKLLPRPQAEAFVQTAPHPLERIDQFTSAVLDSPLMPAVLDWHAGFVNSSGNDEVRLVLGFAGTNEDVRWQLECAAGLGIATRASLDYESTFWAQNPSGIATRSVLPSRLATTARALNATSFVARAGSGLIHYVGEPSPCEVEAGVRVLAGRIKHVFDPNNVLAELSG